MADGIESARAMLARAPAVLIGTGAGMSADCGLPTFRGNEGFWTVFPPARRLGLSFRNLARPSWFDDDPRLAWGFYGWRLRAYSDARPHPGHTAIARLIRHLGEERVAAVTSNVDGMTLTAWPGIAQAEVHGSIHHLQCSRPCRADLWPAVPVAVDPTTFRATGALPRCPWCGAMARPNILMFGDMRWVADRSSLQEGLVAAWLARNPEAVAIEIGAGTAIPTIRRICAQVGGGVIRITCDADDDLGSPADATIAQTAAAALPALLA
jgi:NAD-dependent SIR2 family protein deacetylase